MRKLFIVVLLVVAFSQIAFAGRYYDSWSGRFLQIDPKAHQYPAWSPYAYTLDNPLKYIDPDGRKVRLANGSSESFQKEFAQAAKYLKEHGANGGFVDLEKSKTTYYIKEANLDGSFDPRSNTINWDPTMGVITTKGVVISPTTVLNHEVGHAEDKDKNPDQYNTDRKTPDPQYDNKEEKNVIEGTEQETAKKLGEIKDGEVTRTDHKGTPIKTVGPTSTEPQNEVIVTPKKEEQNGH